MCKEIKQIIYMVSLTIFPPSVLYFDAVAAAATIIIVRKILLKILCSVFYMLYNLQ